MMRLLTSVFATMFLASAALAADAPAVGAAAPEFRLHRIAMVVTLRASSEQSSQGAVDGSQRGGQPPAQ